MEKDECWSAVLDRQEGVLQLAIERFLACPLFGVKDLTPSNLPAEAGVYAFYPRGGDVPFHIGESKNLRQRIYQNQLRGQLRQSPLKRKVSTRTGLQGAALRNYTFDHFLVRFLLLPLGRIELEDRLNAHFGIVESSPRNKSRAYRLVERN